jgi:hypothetical protein
MQSYEKTLNEIMKTDKVIARTDETMQTIRGHIVTMWQQISAHKYKKLESLRKTSA